MSFPSQRGSLRGVGGEGARELPTRSTQVIVVSLLIAVLPASPASAQVVAGSGTTPPKREITSSSLGFVGVDPGTAKAFDLKGGRIMETLPFDVQFYLQSPVDAQVEEVTGHYLQAKRGEPCNLLTATEPPAQTGYLVPLVVVTRNGETVATGASPPLPTPSSGAREPPEGTRELEFVRIIPTGTKENLAGQAANPPSATTEPYAEVSVPAPGLLPNRSICFEFHVAKSVDLTTFHAAASSAIDEQLRDPRWIRRRTFGSRVRRTLATRPDAYNRMRRDILGDILNTMSSGERLSAPSGSYFDPHVNLGGVSDSYIARFNEIVQEQINRYPTIDAIVRTRDQATDLLTDLIHDPTYKKLKESMIAKDLLGAQGLLALTVKRAQELAQGRDAGGAALDLENLWGRPAAPATGAPPPYELELAIGRIRVTEADLADFSRLIARFQARPSWMTSEKVDAAGLTALSTLVDSILSEVKATRENLENLRDRLDRRTDLIGDMVAEMTKELIEVVRIRGTTSAKYETRASWYVSADVGVGFAPDVEGLFTYFGSNIYLRPVNKRAPLRGLDFRKRFSLMIGLTNEKLQQDGQVKGIIGTSPLVFAGGIRINEFVRFSVGALVFKDEDPNPTITDESLAWTPYASVSIDWNLRKMFSQFGGAFGLQDPN